MEALAVGDRQLDRVRRPLLVVEGRGARDGYLACETRRVKTAVEVRQEGCDNWFVRDRKHPLTSP